jgi:proteasome assembly chaperone (PAC2) family protein
MKDLLEFSCQPELKNPSLIIGWSSDAAKLGTRVTDYLNRKIGGQSFYEIEPAEFFPLGGVAIEDNLIQFPESQFYACPKNNLVVFKSTPPSYEWYKFLNLILDSIEPPYHLKELYTIGGMIGLGAHTSPRELTGTFNSAKLKETLAHYNLAGELNYETPPGQRPTLSSFLLWVARRKNIPGVSLWVPVPFYLSTTEDPKAEKRVLEFFNQRFDLGIDLSDLDEEIRQQNEKLSEARSNSPNLDESIRRLGSNVRLSEEESQRLVREIEKLLKGKRG